MWRKLVFVLTNFLGSSTPYLWCYIGHDPRNIWIWHFAPLPYTTNTDPSSIYDISLESSMTITQLWGLKGTHNKVTVLTYHPLSPEQILNKTLSVITIAPALLPIIGSCSCYQIYETAEPVTGNHRSWVRALRLFLNHKMTAWTNSGQSITNMKVLGERSGNSHHDGCPSFGWTCTKHCIS